MKKTKQVLTNRSKVKPISFTQNTYLKTEKFPSLYYYTTELVILIFLQIILKNYIKLLKNNI